MFYIKGNNFRKNCERVKPKRAEGDYEISSLGLRVKQIIFVLPYPKKRKKLRHLVLRPMSGEHRRITVVSFGPSEADSEKQLRVHEVYGFADA